MSLVETLHEKHKERLARFARAAATPKLKPRPSAPFGARKVDTTAPPPEDWAERQRRIHKQPWFEIVDGPTEFKPAASAPPKIEVIQRAVGEHFGIKRHDLICDRRTADICLPRHIMFYLCRRLTTRSLPEIGRKSGGRDHTTVLNGTRKIAKRLQTDERLQASVEMLVARLGGDPE